MNNRAIEGERRNVIGGERERNKREGGGGVGEKVHIQCSKV